MLGSKVENKVLDLYCQFGIYTVLCYKDIILFELIKYLLIIKN